MAEQVDLTAPIVHGNTTNLHLGRIAIDIDASAVVATLTGANGDTVTKVYDATTNPTGASLISTLNTSNNSTTSLIRRVYNRLIADGVIAGTVSGTPQ